MKEQPARYVRMVKTGSTSIAGWLIDRGYGRSCGHRPAVAVARAYPGVPLWGTVRAPLAWYASWYCHCMRNFPRNSRALRSMQAYGRGDHDFKAVMYGLTHPEEVEPYRGDLPMRDHLLNPAGDQIGNQRGGLWSRAIRWFFCDFPPGSAESVGLDIKRPAPGEPAPGSDAWPWPFLVELVRLEDAESHLHRVYGHEEHPLPRRNGKHSTPPEVTTPIDDEIREWVAAADGPMLERIEREHGIRLPLE